MLSQRSSRWWRVAAAVYHHEVDGGSYGDCNEIDDDEDDDDDDGNGDGDNNGNEDAVLEWSHRYAALRTFRSVRAEGRSCTVPTGSPRSMTSYDPLLVF